MNHTNDTLENTMTTDQLEQEILGLSEEHISAKDIANRLGMEIEVVVNIIINNDTGE